MAGDGINLGSLHRILLHHMCYHLGVYPVVQTANLLGNSFIFTSVWYVINLLKRFG